MRIAIVDPFYEDSHRIWAEGLRKHSMHTIEIYAGGANNWKWKMTGGSIEMARRLNHSDNEYDALLVTDMLNLPLFKSLLDKRYQDLPTYLYFHENQITYPWSPSDQDIRRNRDHHYGFINYCSAVISDKIFFNSIYHRDSFLDALPSFMNQFPKNDSTSDIVNIRNKSAVLPIGFELPTDIDRHEFNGPIFVWNHRWEYDKNPELFFETLIRLKSEGYTFQLIVLGKSYAQQPTIFNEIKEILKEEIIHYGYVNSKDEYWAWLCRANIILVTSYQDFFGISTVEAMAAGSIPLLPNRLAYPEHVKSSHFSSCLYDHDDEMYEKLVNIINAKKYMSRDVQLLEHIRRYNYESVIEQYDKMLGA